MREAECFTVWFSAFTGEKGEPSTSAPKTVVKNTRFYGRYIRVDFSLIIISYILWLEYEEGRDQKCNIYEKLITSICKVRLSFSFVTSHFLAEGLLIMFGDRSRLQFFNIESPLTIRGSCLCIRCVPNDNTLSAHSPYR